MKLSAVEVHSSMNMLGIVDFIYLTTLSTAYINRYQITDSQQTVDMKG
jgi:hypothetical protein